MLIEEITQDFTNLLEKQVWAKRGNKVIRKYRCMAGPRKGKTVMSASQCSAPRDMKKSRNLKKTKAKMGSRMARKSKKTKRFNPASKRVRAMNKRR